jgi:hypothetical protein
MMDKVETKKTEPQKKTIETQNEKKASEGKLKTQAGFVTDIGTAGTLMTTICVTDIGTASVPKGAYNAKLLKDMNRQINRMKGNRQGT